MTVVPIDARPSTARWVPYRIERDIDWARNVHARIHGVQEAQGQTGREGPVPASLTGYPTHMYARGPMDGWVDRAVVAARKAHLKHQRRLREVDG